MCEMWDVSKKVKTVSNDHKAADVRRRQLATAAAERGLMLMCAHALSGGQHAVFSMKHIAYADRPERSAVKQHVQTETKKNDTFNDTARKKNHDPDRAQHGVKRPAISKKP